MRTPKKSPWANLWTLLPELGRTLKAFFALPSKSKPAKKQKRKTKKADKPAAMPLPKFGRGRPPVAKPAV